MATVVSQVGQGHNKIDNGGRIFKQSAEPLSNVTEHERLAQEAVRTDHVIGESELPQPPSQSSHLCQSSPMSRCLILIFQKHLATLVTMLKRSMMISHQPSLSRTIAVHIWNGGLSTKCLLRNLVIRCRHEDELLQKTSNC